jgi:hypothetical protein
MLFMTATIAEGLTNDDVRSLLSIGNKMRGWERFGDFLKRQGPLSDDNVLDFNLTDAEVDAVNDIKAKAELAVSQFPAEVQMPFGSITQSPEQARGALKYATQNPFPLQLTQFYRSSKRIFRVPADRQEEFANGDFGNMTWGDLIIPHAGFAVEFAPPLVLRMDANTTRTVSGLIVNRLHDIDPSYPENAIQLLEILPDNLHVQLALAIFNGIKIRYSVLKQMEIASKFELESPRFLR